MNSLKEDFMNFRLWTKFQIFIRFQGSRRKRRADIGHSGKEKNLGLWVRAVEWRDHTVQFYHKVRGQTEEA